ncbi:MAG: hypothetical protein WBZ15_09645 [Mycobacterium sp.]|uniref:hypothetical protein n=1 Tax=Mycobacterium sp. TaxID=1785 RepID=UPI003C4900FD
MIAFRRYGIPYNSGSLPKQFGTVVRKIIKLASPPKDRDVSRSAPTSGRRLSAATGC